MIGDLLFLRFYDAIDYLSESNNPPYVYLFTHDGRLNVAKTVIKYLMDDIVLVRGEIFNIFFQYDKLKNNGIY